MSKRTKQFENLIAELTELKDWEFKEAVKVAKQFRKAQKNLGKAMDKQEQEFMLPAKQSKKQAIAGGLSYECQ